MNDTNDRPDSQGPPVTGGPFEPITVARLIWPAETGRTVPWTLHERAVLQALVRLTDSDTGCTLPPGSTRYGFGPASYSTIANVASVSRAMVIRCVRVLLLAGVVDGERGRLRLDALPKREPNRYRLDVDRLAQWVSQPRPAEWDTLTADMRHGAPPKGRKGTRKGTGGRRTPAPWCPGDTTPSVPGSLPLVSRGHGSSLVVSGVAGTAPQSPTVANRGDRASVVAHVGPQGAGSAERGKIPATTDATKPPHPVTDGQGLLSHDSSAPVKCFPSRDSVALDATVSSEARVPLAAVLRTPPVTGAAEPDPEAIEGGEGEPEGEPWAPRPGRDARAGNAARVVAYGDALPAGDPEQSAEGCEASTSSSLDATRHRDQPDAPQARTRTAAVPLDPDDDLSGSDHAREGYQWTDPDTAARVAWLDSEADAHAQGKRDEKNARDRETRARIAAEVVARPGGPAAVDQVAAEVTARPALAPHVSREWIAYALRDHPLDAPLGPRTLDAIGRALDARPVHGGGPKAHGAIASRVRRAVLEVLGLAPADEQPSTAARPKARKRGWFAPVAPSTMKAKRDRAAGRASA